MKNERGITLVALVITIIILAGVVLNLTLSENGILKIAKNSKENYSNEQEKELLDLEKLYSSIKIATDSEITLTTEELNKYIDKKVEEKLNEDINKKINEKIKMQQPTGIKSETYIGIYNEEASVYDIKTSMNGLPKTIDENNRILEYLSYSDESGYTIKKSGWYFVDMKIKQNAGRVWLNFILNSKCYGQVDPYCENSPNAGDCNSFSIYLKEGDTFYFSSRSTVASD